MHPACAARRADQLEPRVVLVPLVRRAVDDEQQLGTGLAGQGDGAALLPEVLADGDGHVDAADPDHGEVGAGREDPVLVEDAVVGQVVLGVAGHDPAPVQDRRRSSAEARCGRGRCRAVPASGAVEVARRRPAGRRGRRRPGRRRAAPSAAGEASTKRRAQREVLDRVAGEHHLGEGHQVGAALGGRRRPPADRRGVAGEVADGRVDLGQGESQLRHAASVVGGADDARPGTSRATRGAPGAPAARWLTPGARPAASARWCRRHPRGRGSSWRTARCRWTRGGCGRRAGPSRPASAGAGGGRGRR